MVSSERSTSAIDKKQLLAFRWEDLQGADWLPGNALEAIRLVESRSVIWTGWVGDRCMAVFGYTFLFAHLVEVWAYLHPGIVRYPIVLHRTALKVLQSCRSLRRVQAAAMASQPRHGAWLERLGLVKEGPPMREAGPNGESVQRYVWFPQEGHHGGS